MNCITVTAANFESEVVASPVPVLLDFWAPWCGPCRMVAPVLEELAAEFAGKVKIGKVNVDEETGLAEKHAVMSIPTLILYKNGNISAKQIGALPKEALKDLILQSAG